jgi:hypothetical protein
MDRIQFSQKSFVLSLNQCTAHHFSILSQSKGSLSHFLSNVAMEMSHGDHSCMLGAIDRRQFLKRGLWEKRVLT